MKCERKNSPQGLDIHKMVHIAMEKCFVGEMVYLAFRLANTGKNSSQLKANVLPASKATNFGRYCKIPELLANGICRVQNETKHRSIADVLIEYLSHFEKSVLLGSWRIAGNCTADDCSRSITNKESRISMDETDCDIHDAVSPRNLLGVSSNKNNFVLSMLSSDNESNNNTDVLRDLSCDFENGQRSACFERDQVEGNSSQLRKSSIICKENLTLSDLQQSFCCTSNTNDPCMWTNIREDSPNSGSVTESLSLKVALFSERVSEFKENLKPVRLPASTADICSKSHVVNTDDSSCEVACGNEGPSGRDKDLELPRLVTHSPNVNNAYNEFDMFDSPTSEDLDAFLAEISFTWLTTKPEQIDGNLNQPYYKDDKRCPGESGELESTSDSHIVCCDHEPKTCLTSTPSLANRSCHKTSDLEGVINSSFSPIYTEFISTPERNPNDTEKNTSVVYDESHEMFPTAEKQHSKLGLTSTPILQSQFGCISNCLRSSLSRKTTCQKPSLKVSSRIKGKQKSKNLLRCIVSSKKSTCCSNNSHLKNAVDISQENLNDSPDPCSPLVRDTTPLEKWTENSLLLFEDESYVNGSKEEKIKSRGKFQDLPTNTLLACTESDVDTSSPNSPLTNGDRACLKNNIFDEKLLSTYDSPLLFSPW